MVNLLWVLPFAIVGLAISIYIIYSKRYSKNMVCVIGQEKKCNEVITSKYNTLFGFPNEILGIVYYGLVALLVILAALGITSIGALSVLSILIIIAIPAALFSLYLIYVQWKILEMWCEYCVTSAIASIAILILELI